MTQKFKNSGYDELAMKAAKNEAFALNRKKIFKKKRI